MKRILTEYTFRTDRVDRPLRLAVAPDIHSSPFEDVLEEFSRCDAVLIPGDLVDRHRRNNSNALRFLETAPDCAPVFLSIGNHERKYRDRETFLQKVRESRVGNPAGQRKHGLPRDPAGRPFQRPGRGAGQGIPEPV